MRAVSRAAAIVALALPGALTVYAAFNGGGYFAGTQGLVVVLLALVLLLRVTLAEDPFAGARRTLVLAAGALALFATWTLVSAAWSHAPARALVEFDRALLYVLVLVLFGSLPMTPARLRWMVRGVAAAAVAVCAVALITRTLPNVWPIAPNVSNQRLSYPITYWNSLGLLGALGAILCLHLSATEREPRAVRVLATAALPVLASTVYLTLSRGAIAAGTIGLLAYVVLARPRALLGALVAGIPATALAVSVTYRADRLASRDPTTAGAVAQGHHVARVIALCVLGAALARLALLVFDARVERRSARHVSRRVAAVAIGAALFAGSIAFVASGAPARVRHQYHLFVTQTSPRGRADQRRRITDPSSNGRVDEWRIALKGFRAQRLHGGGAGTYQWLWARYRPYEATVVDGHSLYLEVLGELGIVGLALLALALTTLLAGCAHRIRGPDRALFAAVFVVLATWALRASLDWDWEMPVVTLPVLALGAAALAAREHAREPARVRAPGRPLRVAIGAGCLVLAITPARVAVSQIRLDDGVRAFKRGDCPRAIDSALGSIAAVGARPEPYEILGFCDVRIGQGRLAVRALRNAVRRDPGDWEFRYGLALTRAAAGLDPRPDVRAALKLNPREGMVRDAAQRFRTGNPRLWRRRALTARLPPV